jgi:integrase
MKKHRLGAWIGQETYPDKKTGERKRCASWTVKYAAFDRKPGDYRQGVERGFASESDAIAWWVLQKQNQHRPIAKAEAVKEAPVTLGEFLDRWLKASKSALSPGAFRQYESHVREHLRPSLGSKLLLDLERSPERIEEAMAAWNRKDGRSGRLSARFTKSVWSTLRTALNKAKRLRLITTNPCDFVDPPRVERKEMAALDPVQVQAYLEAFRSTDISAAIATAIGSGCRCGELLALRWRDVDLERGTLRIERSLERVAIRTAQRVSYELAFKEPKSKRSRRTIPLPPFVIDRLRRHRLEQAERFLSAGAGRPDAETLVFEDDGRPWVPTTFGMLFARLRDAANLPKVRLHDLRHSYASLLLQSGADLKVVSTALGHSSVAITSDLYVHLAPVMLQSAAHRLDALIESGRKANGH